MLQFIKTSAFAISFAVISLFSIAQNNAATDTLHKKLPEQDLENVTVTGKKKFMEMSAGKVTLNVAQSSIAAGNNVYDILKRAPGVTEQSDVLSYKGKSTRVLINGRPANVTGEELKNLLSTMPGTGVEKVELLSNPSAKYDAQGGAVINIILAKNKNFGTNYLLNAGAGAGTYAKGNVGIDVNHRSKNVNVYGGYTFSHNEQYGKFNSVRTLENASINTNEFSSQARNSNIYKLGMDYDISKKSSAGFMVNGFINYRNKDVFNKAGIFQPGISNDSSTAVNSNGHLGLKGPMINVYYKTKLDSTGKELVLNADHMAYNKNWRDNFVNRSFIKGEEYGTPQLIGNQSSASIRVYSFTTDYSQPLKNGKLEAGLKASFTTTDNNTFWQNNNGGGWMNDTGRTNHFIYDEMVSAAYANYSTAIKKWSFQGGLRAELTNTKGNSITIGQVNKNSYLDLFPNLAVQFEKNGNNQFGFSYRKSIYRYGFGYVNPFITYQNKYAYSQGNPDIRPELSDNFELSYTFQQAYSLSLNYTHGRRTLGEIFVQGPDNTTISSYGNYNSSDVLYASFSMYKPVTKYWTLSVNPMAGFMKLNNESTLASATGNKNILITQLSWTNSFTFKKGWNAETSIMYISPFQYGSYKTKTLFSMDLGVSKNILKNKASLRFSISDIFNTLAYNKEINYGGVISSVEQKEESRFANVSFRYRFGNKNVKARKQRESKVGDVRNRID